MSKNHSAKLSAKSLTAKGERALVVTPAEAAKTLKISSSKIHTLIRTGKLDAIKLGPRSWRIPKRALKAYLDKLS